MAGKRRGRHATRLLWAILTGSAAVLTSAGCSAKTRYEVLTFFFEGVPAPGSRLKQEAVKPAASGRLEHPVSYHSTFREKQCGECHSGKGRFLKKPVPGLCWRCHRRAPESTPWNHAPARVGDCLACHVAHEAPTRHLLVREGESLCFGCHRETYVRGLPRHSGIVIDTCLNCHPPHEGGTLGTARAAEQHPDETLDRGPGSMFSRWDPLGTR